MCSTDLYIKNVLKNILNILKKKNSFGTCFQIDNEEYGEALQLARAYGLDCDLVYQRQWRSQKVSVATIHDYLVIS